MLFVKNGSGSSASIKYKDLFGSRSLKYDTLFSESLPFIDEPLSPTAPYFFLKDINSDDQRYAAYFSLSDLFENSATGIKFRKDNLLIRRNFGADDVRQMIQDVVKLEPSALERKYGFSETADWKIENQRQNFDATGGDRDIVEVCYRPLDFRYTYYPEERISKIIPRGDSRKNLMVHHFRGPNLAILTGRQNKGANISHFFATSAVSEMKTAENSVQSTHFPLYLYPEAGTFDEGVRLNLDPKLYTAICKAAGIDPADQAGPDDDFCAATGDARPSEVKVFDYIYGVLHSPAYRETFAEFLKIDFPRIPYPPSPEVFRHVSEKGEQLRRLHLMEPAAIGETPYPYMGEGDDEVASGYPKFEKSSPSSLGEGDHAQHGGGGAGAAGVGANTPPPPASPAVPLLETSSGRIGKVHINKHQYFSDVPEIAWNFHIGGYQPAQKWLKDRRGRSLSWDDIGHYQKIVKILSETDRIMKEIELPLD